MDPPTPSRRGAPEKKPARHRIAPSRGGPRYRPELERLEDRLAPATITWDGGPSGTSTNWNTAANWVGDVLPGPSDDAVIGAAFSGITISTSANVAVKSVTSDAALVIGNNLSFTVTGPCSCLFPDYC